MDEYITRKNAISAVCFGCNQEFSDEPCEPSECTIRQSIMALPTADVAPKTEVEKLQNELVIWKQNRFNLYQKLECYEMARQKVAREIFEEIEKMLIDSTHIPDCARFVDIDKLAELKKKYTGVEDGDE